MGILSILGYVNIGGSLPFVTSFFGIILAIILSFLAIILAILRRFCSKIKRYNWLIWIIIILFLTSIIIFVVDRRVNKMNGYKKVIVLGIDALDPDIILSLIDKNRLPNFKKLQQSGSFKKLSTVMPPQSPVAWASFATGVNPAGHGLFDFIKCDKNYKLDLALTEVIKPGSIKIFGKDFQTGKPKIISGMKGKTLWQYTKDYNIPTYVYFLPNTFPPDRVKGRMFSGMGVPDVYGTEGTFHFYTQDESFKDKIDKSSGKIFCFDKDRNKIDTVIYGPQDISKKGKITIPLEISVNKRKVILDIQNKKIELHKENWTKWIHIRFNLGLFRKVHGICRFYLEDTEPLKLYLSPINFDPRKSPFPISYPENYSKELVYGIGLYHTLGMPYDTKALSEDILTDTAFLEQANCIFNEREKILFKELPDFKKGVFIFYFNILDSIQHTFWRFIDEKHPLYEKSKHKNVIYNYYQAMDGILGKVLDYVDKNTTLIVLSDHGFTSFRKIFHINTWLRQNGYLSFKKPNLKEGREFFQDIDWSKTRAYAVGFNGIYINLKDRQTKGVVKPNEVEKLQNEIIEKLKKFKDTKMGKNVMHEVYKREEIFKGAYYNKAPDLIVGYNKGYRASWQTALGGVPEKILEDNKKKWSGTHLIDSELIPGVIFADKKINLDNPNIKDILPTVLKILHINSFEELEGESLF